MATSVGGTAVAISTSPIPILVPICPAPQVTLSFCLLFHQLQALVQLPDLCPKAGNSGFQLQLLTGLVELGTGSGMALLGLF